MEKQKKDIYYSKVMLFGEYSIIVGSMGLTIPYSHFNGALKFINQDSYTNLAFARNSNKQLAELAQYISILKKSNQLVSDFDTDRLSYDIDQGLYFESTIPEGYGLGSSGALVASIYNEYAINKIEAHAGLNDDDLFRLKKLFAQIESFYHGTSSGIDPLICYLKHPIVLENSHHISSVGIPRTEVLNEDAIFLVDAEVTGKTGPLVKHFMDKTQDKHFSDMLNHKLIPATNSCIKNVLSGNLKEMYASLSTLSDLQLLHFTQMIPNHIQEYWEAGRSNQLFTMKLCGSGGGGFFLGFTRNYAETKSYFETMGKSIIPVYQEI